MIDLSTLYLILIYLLGLPIKWTSIGRVDYRALRERERRAHASKLETLKGLKVVKKIALKKGENLDFEKMLSLFSWLQNLLPLCVII